MSLTVFGNATFVAAGSIDLNDGADESLSIRIGDLGGDFGHASFTSNGNDDIDIGFSGSANFQSLQFNTNGNVTIYEDSNTDLQGVSVVGGNLQLTSAGNVTDTQNATRASASLTVSGNSNIEAGMAWQRQWNDHAGR